MTLIDSIKEACAAVADDVGQFEATEARGGSRARRYLDEEGFFVQSDAEFFEDLGYVA